MAKREKSTRERLRTQGREDIDKLFQEFEFVDFEQRDVMRDFLVEQSVSNTPGILRRLEAYVRAKYTVGTRELDDAAKAEILEDFKQWTGGFTLDGCDDVLRLKYLEYALSKDFRRSDVEPWLRGYGLAKS